MQKQSRSPERVGTDVQAKRTWLDRIEALGNKLPEPAILFALLAVLVVVLSVVGASAGWKVQPVRLAPEMAPVVDATTGAPLVDAKGAPLQRPVVNERGEPVVKLVPSGAELSPKSLLTGEGLYWMLSSMVRNFTGLPAIGLVFVSMLGIGLAEKFGLFSALMRGLAMATPKALLTPVVVFIGANSSVASDAGYIILPPLAAALYLAVGRSPIAGLAAAFAGVAGGFGGGLFPTASDGFLAGVATDSARVIDATHRAVEATHNLYFKAASAVVVTICGWLVTDYIVEPRLLRAAERTGAAGGQDQGSDAVKLGSAERQTLTELALKRTEIRGLLAAGVALALVAGAFGAMILIPGAPLHGDGQPTLANGLVPTQQPVVVMSPDKAASASPAIPPERVLASSPLVVAEGAGKPRLTEGPGDRWSQVIVPMIFLSFLVPGMAYGMVTGTLASQRDFIEGLYHGIRGIVPVLVIAFFLGQFVNYFQYTGLDRMLAYAGGSLLVRADVPVPVLIVLFVLLVVAGDFAMSGMLSKFGVMAPIFIPMFMMVGISPELTTAAYRIGDSVVNIITPLNSYLLIILVVFQRYQSRAGLGSLISLMLPYSIVLGVAWTAFLLVWYWLGVPLGSIA